MEWIKLDKDNMPPFGTLLMIGRFDDESCSAETGYFRGFTEEGFMFAKMMEKDNTDIMNVFMKLTETFTATHYFVVELPKDYEDEQRKKTSAQIPEA